jgi:hypothetical protein
MSFTFYSHMPCHGHAILKGTFQGHLTARHGRGMACVHYHQPSRDDMWATCPRPASFGYHADLHEGHGTVGESQGHGMICVK